MRRKIIKQGIGGNAIYLPKKWVTQEGLTPGDEINLFQTPEGLLISTEEQKQTNKKIELEFSSISKSRLRTILASLYREGYQEIRLRFETTPSITELNEVVDSLLGFIIVEQNSHEVQIKNTISTQKENIEKLFEKFIISINYQFTYCSEFLYENKGNKEDILQLAKSNIRQRDFLQRLISTRKQSQKLSYEYYLLCAILEKISGLLKLFGSEKRISIEEKEFNTLKEKFNKIRKHFLKRELNELITVSDNISKLKKESNKINNSIYSLLIYKLFDLSSKCVSIVSNSTNISLS